ncbi:MAG: D-alanyl-D-alanine carboxypeptidase family protein [Clostridia bacterium]
MLKKIIGKINKKIIGKTNKRIIEKTNKKTMKSCACIILVCILCINANIFSAEIEEKLELKSPAYLVMEAESGRILLHKNGYEKRSIASLTKVITSIVVLENSSINETVHISKKAASMGGSTVGIQEGANIQLEDLMYGLLLCSGNDCAVALAEHVGGSVEGFASLMNDKAKEIGALDSHFVTPHGLDNVEHYSTCVDMAKITRYALRNNKIKEIINTRTYAADFNTFTKLIKNTNALLKNYEYATGVKTGFTNQANRCLIGSAKKNNLEVISVVLGSETTEIRFGESEQILEYALNNYTKTKLDDSMKWYVKVPIVKGKKDSYTAHVSGKCTYPLSKNEQIDILVTQTFIPEIIPPLKIGAKIGEISMSIGNDVFYTQEIFLEENIAKKNILDYMKNSFKDMFKMDIKF